MFDLLKERSHLEGLTALKVLEFCYDNFDPDRIKLSTSFGAEGIVLVDMLSSVTKYPCIFTVDTGRFFEETYDIWQRIAERYGLGIEAYYPDPVELAAFVKEMHPNAFFESVEKRKRCCEIRKINPMKRALLDAHVWISGVRREETSERNALEVVVYSEQFDVYKVSPLLKWSEADVWNYIKNNSLPYNALYDRGFTSIGCAPCCRPAGRTAEARAGRWWWEKDEAKECGIHIEGGELRRTRKKTDWNI